MCGICGKIIFNNKQIIDESTLVNMTNAIIHRGPDDFGYFYSENKKVGLGHRRLSIIDLFTGNQPMSDVENSIYIVFNGEIYNFQELKKELLAKGCIFHTNSDTEVIINLYKQYGESQFHRLNGIFAFALYDTKKECLILARDHFGVKPIYYFHNNDVFLFGSEIKCLLQDKAINKSIDIKALDNFLTFRFNPSPFTLFTGIKKLNAGNYLKISLTGEHQISEYWRYIPKTDHLISLKDAVYEYQILLEKAVKKQMLSDVPVGLFLSGGIDSAIIGHLMQKYSPNQVNSFSIGFEGKGSYNELHDAKQSSLYINSRHHEMILTQKEYMEFFHRSFYYTEEPIAEPTIPALYYLSKLASQYVKVVLAGQGADEPLAGYKRYFGEKYIAKYNTLISFLSNKQILRLLKRNERFKRAIYSSRFKNEIERFLAIYTIFTPDQKRYLFKIETYKKLENNDLGIVQRLYTKTNGLSDSLTKMLFIDTRLSLCDDLLLFGDKITMANSLEMRVPFLDNDLVLFLESLPSDFKLHGMSHKYMHKLALKKWLPIEIINRKKRGFETPIDEWLQNDLANECKLIINDSSSASRQFFNLNIVNNMIDLHKNRKENYRRQIFAILSFEYWYKTFFSN